MIRGRATLALLLSGVVPCGCGSGETAPAPEPVRIVLITLDTLRLDSLASMPRLGEWAEGGSVYERYYSCSSTTQPAHATLLTGLHPWEHGVTANGMVLAEERRTLPESLSAAGFRCGAVVASFPVHGEFGFAQGFDVYDQDFGGGEGPERRHRTLHSSAAQVSDRALAMLDGLGGDRQFLWFHYFDPHSPYGDHTGARAQRASPGKILEDIRSGAVEAEERIAWARDLYAAELGYLDRQLARVLQRLEQESDAIETHVLVVSDHGESFGEQGSLGHGKRLTRELIHVPLIVRSRRLAPGARGEAVGSSDVATTLLALAELGDPAGNGRSLLQAERARHVLGMRRSFAEPYSELRTDGEEHALDAHLFFFAEGDLAVTGNADAVSVWDTGAPVEDAALAARCRKLFAELEGIAAELDTETIEDVEALEALRALGYTR